MTSYKQKCCHRVFVLFFHCCCCFFCSTLCTHSVIRHLSQCLFHFKAIVAYECEYIVVVFSFKQFAMQSRFLLLFGFLLLCHRFSIIRQHLSLRWSNTGFYLPNKLTYKHIKSLASTFYWMLY